MCNKTMIAMHSITMHVTPFILCLVFYAKHLSLLLTNASCEYQGSLGKGLSLKRVLFEKGCLRKGFSLRRGISEKGSL